MNLTIRNIPEEVVDKIRTLSKVERQSMNSEMLVILEQGLNEKLGHQYNNKLNLTKELQVGIWRGLAAKWEDDRSTQEIIKIFMNIGQWGGMLNYDFTRYRYLHRNPLWESTCSQ